MLRITLRDGNAQDDFCDYCRKSATGKEIIDLEATGKSWRDRQYVTVHVECLNRQVERQRSGS